MRTRERENERKIERKKKEKKVAINHNLSATWTISGIYHLTG